MSINKKKKMLPNMSFENQIKVFQLYFFSTENGFWVTQSLSLPTLFWHTMLYNYILYILGTLFSP